MNAYIKLPFKNTEIGEIPENWSVDKLINLSEKIGSGATPRGAEKVYKNEGVSLIRSQNILLGSFDKQGLVYIDENEANKLSNVVVKNGDILLNITGDSVARVSLVDPEILPARVNQHVSIIRSNEKVNNKYLFYYLLSHQTQDFLLGMSMAGATRKALTKNMIENLKISLPPIEEQKQIASILSSLDDKIELNQKTIKTLEEIGQTLFKRWFIDFEFPNEKGEPYKSSGGEMVESELGEIPKGWSLKKLSDISDISIGRTPPRLESKWFSRNDQDIKWISIRDMGGAGTYIYETSEFLTKEAIEKFRVPIIPKNTVILSFKLTVGRLSITTEEMVSNEAIAHIKLTEDKYSPEYTYLLLKKFDFTSLGSTSSIATAVNSASIKNISILAPNTCIVDEFSNTIKPIFSEIFVLTQETKKLKLLLDSLLPNLLSGKIKV